MYRDAKFKEGLQNIRSKYDNLLSLQLTNPGNQQYVREQLKTAVDQLDKYSTADLSLPENVGSVMSLFDPVTDDKGVLNDMAFTQHMNKQKSKIEQLTIDNPDQVAPQNVFPLLQAEQRYRSGARTATPDYANFQPYYNFEKDDNTFLSKLNEDISNDPEIYNVKDPLTGEVIGLRGEREVKELSKQKIMKAMANSFDPRKISQMQLDYNYAHASGVFTPESAKKGIDQEVSDWNAQVQQAKAMRDSGNYTIAQVGELDKQISTANKEIGRLNLLKASVGVDPSRVSDYYSFDKYANDYVRQKAEEYSYKKEGAFKANEYDKEIFKFGLDQYMESLKSELRIKEEQNKAKLKGTADGDSTTGKRPDGSFIYEPPLKKIIDSVATTGAAQIASTSPQWIPLLGNAQREKDNSITWINTGGGEADPAKKIYVKEGSDSLDPTTSKLLVVNNGIGEAIKDIELTNPNYFSKKYRNTAQMTDTRPDAVSYKPVTDGEKAARLGQMLDQYKQNPKSFTASGQKALQKLQTTLEQNGATSVDQTDIANYTKFANSDKGKSLIDLGVLLNKDGKGKYEFIPDGNNNVIGMSDGKLGASGFIALSEDDVKRMGLPAAQMERDGLMSRVAPAVGYEDVNGKAAKVITKKFWVPVVLPVNGDLESINNKMFEEGDMQNIQLKERYEATQMQASAFKEFAAVTQFAQGALEPTSTNTFRPRPGGELDRTIQDALRAADGSPAGKQVRETYQQLLNTPQTRYDLINNLNSLLQSVQTTISPSNVQLNKDQLNNMNTIRSVGKQVGASERDIQIAIATAMTESGLTNLNYGDRDSVGMFQQRPSQGWGTVEQLVDPTEAIKRFFVGVEGAGIPGLLSIKDRDKKSIEQLAQQIQRSAYPDRYGKWAKAFNFK